MLSVKNQRRLLLHHSHRSQRLSLFHLLPSLLHLHHSQLHPLPSLLQRQLHRQGLIQVQLQDPIQAQLLAPIQVLLQDLTLLRPQALILLQPMWPSLILS